MLGSVLCPSIGVAAEAVWRQIWTNTLTLAQTHAKQRRHRLDTKRGCTPFTRLYSIGDALWGAEKIDSGDSVVFRPESPRNEKQTAAHGIAAICAPYAHATRLRLHAGLSTQKTIGMWALTQILDRQIELVA